MFVKLFFVIIKSRNHLKIWYWTFRSSLIAQLVKNLPAIQETPIWFLVGKLPWRRDRLHTPVFLGLPCGSAGKESACNEEDLGSIPGLGRSPGAGNGYPLQYSGLEDSMDSPWNCKEVYFDLFSNQKWGLKLKLGYDEARRENVELSLLFVSQKRNLRSKIYTT